jgi:bifunctional UDP-N-acetylglucosamine pyrophosphorylase/glucosamine-1-phosphate N-acetyltransferase
MNICAVIPAAGRGSRLGIDRPKILAPVAGEVTIWSVLRDRLRPFVDRIHVVLAASAVPAFTAALTTDADRARVTTSVQAVPLGMGDAIFGARAYWRSATTILVIWGDQVHVSSKTIRATLAVHAGSPYSIGLPLVALSKPYVEYRLDEVGRLTGILQSREGDLCLPGGFSDVGTFVLSTQGLGEAWDEYLPSAPRGRQTGEVNFLPFLLFLSQRGWAVRCHRVDDANEARGVNTPDDLAFFRLLYSSGAPPSPP